MKKAHPFAGLLGTALKRAPRATCRATVVVAGKPVTDVRQIEQVMVDAERDDDRTIAEARELAKAVQRARDAARYQRMKANPEQMAKRKEWVKNNPEKVAAIRARNREKNRERNRESARLHARRKYLEQPELCRARARAYYQAHAEELRAKARERGRQRYAENREQILADRRSKKAKG